MAVDTAAGLDMMGGSGYGMGPGMMGGDYETEAHRYGRR